MTKVYVAPVIQPPQKEESEEIGDTTILRKLVMILSVPELLVVGLMPIAIMSVLYGFLGVGWVVSIILANLRGQPSPSFSEFTAVKKVGVEPTPEHFAEEQKLRAASRRAGLSYEEGIPSYLLKSPNGGWHSLEVIYETKRQFRQSVEYHRASDKNDRLNASERWACDE